VNYRDSVELDRISIECPICDRSIPATSKTCQFCGTVLSMSGLDELEELALHVDDFYHDSPLPVKEESVKGLETDNGSLESVTMEPKPIQEEVSEHQEADTESIEAPEEIEEVPDKPMTMAEKEQGRRDLKKERKEEKIALKTGKKEKKSHRKAEKREKRLHRKEAKRSANDGGTTEEHSP
jgi:hypothetical protein